MTHDSDAEDARHLSDGDIAYLLAKYEPVVRARCVARLRGDLAADDVAQNVMLRLLDEFHRGKRYGDVPYRVVVHQVVGWTLNDHFRRPPHRRTAAGRLGAGGARRASRPRASRPAASCSPTCPSGRAARASSATCSASRSTRSREQLEMTRNAVDQALHRAHARLRDLVADA